MAGGDGRAYRPAMLEINAHPTPSETWEGLGRRLRVDSVRLAAIGGLGHPTSSTLAVREVPTSGEPSELLRWAGIDRASIARAARALLKG